MKNNLLKNTMVKGVTAHRYNIVSGATPRAAGFQWEGMEQNRERDLDLIWSGIDFSFFKMLDINLVEGRVFSTDFSTDKEAVILNEAAINEMNLDKPIGKWISIGDWKKTIIGVVKDVHYRSTRQKVEPRVYYLSDFSSSASGIMLIKIVGDKTKETISYIESEWNKVNTISPFEFGFIDEEYENLYKSETKLAIIFRHFTFLTIFISCLGLFGLSLFTSEQRSKEIGIRKVLGATVFGIVIRLCEEFTVWILISNIIAWPIAYYFINDWLSNFAYKISIGIIPFIFAGSFALIIALLTISYQAVKSALVNPVESLRYE
jgi:putative ABC transport system permease protein